MNLIDHHRGLYEIRISILRQLSSLPESNFFPITIKTTTHQNSLTTTLFASRPHDLINIIIKLAERSTQQLTSSRYSTHNFIRPHTLPTTKRQNDRSYHLGGRV